MSTPPSAAPPKKRRFLVLEDEPLLADLYEMCIRDWFQDVEIARFADGDAAVRTLASFKPDMFIMDWAHPGLKGDELLKQLAARQTGFVILLTSGLFGTEVKPAFSPELKVGYLPKPFGVLQFWRALNEFIGPSDFPEKQALLALLETR
jgi:DNA-binding response OmpR family regulator